jgi:hypothetical protein
LLAFNKGNLYIFAFEDINKGFVVFLILLKLDNNSFNLNSKYKVFYINIDLIIKDFLGHFGWFSNTCALSALRQGNRYFLIRILIKFIKSYKVIAFFFEFSNCVELYTTRNRLRLIKGIYISNIIIIIS